MPRIPVILSVLAGALLAENYPPPFPRTGATLLFENDRVQIWDVHWLKGHPSPMHEHPYDQIAITLVPGSIKLTRPDGKASVGQSRYASASFVHKGTIHAEEGMSDLPQHKIMIEVKPSTAPTSGPSQGLPGAVKILDNDRAVAWDFTWRLGQPTPRYVDDHDTVTVFLEGGTIRTTAGEGHTTEAVRKSGDAVYTAHGATSHIDEAVSGSPRAIIVQLK